MSIELNIWIKGKKWHVSTNIGWYRGEDFALLEFGLFSTYNGDVVDVVKLKIAKFIFSISAYREN